MVSGHTDQHVVLLIYYDYQAQPRTTPSYLNFVEVVPDAIAPKKVSQSRRTGDVGLGRSKNTSKMFTSAYQSAHPKSAQGLTRQDPSKSKERPKSAGQPRNASPHRDTSIEKVGAQRSATFGALVHVPPARGFQAPRKMNPCMCASASCCWILHLAFSADSANLRRFGNLRHAYRPHRSNGSLVKLLPIFNRHSQQRQPDRQRLIPRGQSYW
jgi:hypothetical protein